MYGHYSVPLVYYIDIPVLKFWGRGEVFKPVKLSLVYGHMSNITVLKPQNYNLYK